LSICNRVTSKMQIFDKSLIKHPKNYIWQSFLALITMLVLMSFVEFFTQTAIVAALGASTFIVFAMPWSITAAPRRLIGGHVVGIICGLLCYYIFIGGPLEELSKSHDIIVWFAYALSVSLSLFMMAVTNTEHPPAAATALGIVAYGCSWQTVVFVISFAVGLSIVKRLLKPCLKNLF
jgi:CBS-domain-containing membrane protein